MLVNYFHNGSAPSNQPVPMFTYSSYSGSSARSLHRHMLSVSTCAPPEACQSDTLPRLHSAGKYVSIFYVSHSLVSFVSPLFQRFTLHLSPISSLKKCTVSAPLVCTFNFHVLLRAGSVQSHKAPTCVGRSSELSLNCSQVWNLGWGVFSYGTEKWNTPTSMS